MSNPVVRFEVVGQHADTLRQLFGELPGWEFQLSHPTRYGKVEARSGGIAGGAGQAPWGQRGWTAGRPLGPCAGPA